MTVIDPITSAGQVDRGTSVVALDRPQNPAPFTNWVNPTTGNLEQWDGFQWTIVIDVASNITEYGDGSGGDITIAADTTLAANKTYNNLTVAAGKILTTGGYWIKVKGTLTWGDSSAKIKLGGGNGSNGTAGSGTVAGSGGAGGTAAAGNTVPASKGGVSGASGGAGGSGTPSAAGNGGSGGSGNAELFSLGSSGVAGGAGGAGGNDSYGDANTSAGSAGTAGAGGSASMQLSDLVNRISQAPLIQGTIILGGHAGNGGGGGGGGGAGAAGESGGGGGGGGGSGANGGNIWLAAKTITGAGTVEANGGTGGTGGNGGNASPTTNTGAGAGGAGGAGGNGGCVVVIYKDISTWTGSQIVVTGGSGGSGGSAGTGNGGNGGGTGNTGATGIALLLNRNI